MPKQKKRQPLVSVMECPGKPGSYTVSVRGYSLLFGTILADSKEEAEDVLTNFVAEKLEGETLVGGI